MARARLGDMTFIVNPSKVEWDFKVRMAETETVGGRVIQIFGTDLGDMTVVGRVSNGDKARGDTEGWEALERMRVRIEEMAQDAADAWSAPPVRFTVPSEGWAFDVFIKSFGPVVHSNDQPSPEFTLGLFIVEDITGKVKRGIQDKYLERLTDGVGWSQSEYNGPTEKEVEAELAAYQGSPGLRYKEEMIDVVEGIVGSMSGLVPGMGPIAGPEGLNAFLWALRMQESGGDYQAYNGDYGASGAYQYIPSTWNNYKGYATARDAPPHIQDERAAMDCSRNYEKYGRWEDVAAIHYSGQPFPDGGGNQSEGNYPTIRQYVQQVMSKMAQAPTN